MVRNEVFIRSKIWNVVPLGSECGSRRREYYDIYIYIQKRNDPNNKPNNNNAIRTKYVHTTSGRVVVVVTEMA